MGADGNGAVIRDHVEGSLASHMKIGESITEAREIQCRSKGMLVSHHLYHTVPAAGSRYHL